MWCCHAQVCLGTEFLVEESEERGREWAVDTGSPGHTGGEAGGGVVTRWWHNTVSPTVTLLHVQLTLIRQFQAWSSLPALQGWRESWICSKYAVHPFYTIIRIFNWKNFLLSRPRNSFSIVLRCEVSCTQLPAPATLSHTGLWSSDIIPVIINTVCLTVTQPRLTHTFIISNSREQQQQTQENPVTREEWLWWIKSKICQYLCLINWLIQDSTGRSVWSWSREEWLQRRNFDCQSWLVDIRLSQLTK